MSQHTPKQNPVREVCCHNVPANWHCSKCEAGDNGITTIFAEGVGFLTVPTEHKEKIVRALNSYEGLISENAIKSAVITQLSKQNEKLLESAKKAADYINNALIDPDEEDEEIMAILNKAIAQAEARP